MPQQDRSKMDKTKVDSEQKPAAGGEVSAKVKRDARRRILTGGLVGAPIVMTLASRPALANGCSLSGMTSGNASTTNNTTTCHGLTPGYWKTHDSQCESYFTVGPCNPITEIMNNGGTCHDYSVPTVQECWDFRATLTQRSEKRKMRQYIRLLEEEWPNSPPFGTPFASVFGSGLTTDPNGTMMQCLWLDDSPPAAEGGMPPPSPVLAHCAAAWLNAHHFGIDSFGMSPEGVVQFVQENMLVDPIGMKDTLEMMNERG